MERQYEEDMREPQEPPPLYQPSAHRTAQSIGKGKAPDIWGGGGAQEDHTSAHHYHSIYPTLRHNAVD